MESPSVSAVAVFAAAVLAMPGAASAEVREVRLEEAIRLGLDHSPDLKMGQRDVDKAHAEAWSALGQMGPKLSSDGGLQLWDKATDIDFAASLLTVIPAAVANQLGIDPSKIPPTRVLDRFAWNASLQAAQPLTPLYPMYFIWRANRLAESAAAITEEGTRESVRYRVSEAFFRVLAAQRMADVAQKSVEQVDSHLKTARSFEAAGVVGRDDVLRAEAALARAQDGLNQAKSGAALARVALNVMLGLPARAETQPVGDYPDNPPDLAIDDIRALDRALSGRAEVRATDTRFRLAGAARHAAIGAMIPTVAGVLRYTHQEGSLFQREDQWFVGLSFSWNFWEWGASYFKVRSADADRDKAEEAKVAVRDAVVVDVEKAWLDLTTGRSSIDMNRKAVEASEEALRVVTKKFEASTATTTDVLDAQSALTQARASYEVAIFNYYTALANLRRAVGSEL